MARAALLSSLLILAIFAIPLATAQQEDVAISVVDSFTGEQAEGISVKVFDGDDVLVWTSEGGGNASLDAGQYTVRAELALFGYMVPLNNQPIAVAVNDTNEFTLYLSFVFIPIKYVPYLIYGLLGLLALTLISGISRRMRRRRKSKQQARDAADDQTVDQAASPAGAPPSQRYSSDSSGSAQRPSAPPRPNMDRPDVDFEYDPGLIELDQREDWWVFPSGRTISLDGRMPVSEAWAAMSERGEQDSTVLVFDHERGRVSGFVTNEEFRDILGKVTGVGAAGTLSDMMQFKDLLDH